jgi:hypothetical protein
MEPNSLYGFLSVVAKHERDSGAGWAGDLIEVSMPFLLSYPALQEVSDSYRVREVSRGDWERVLAIAEGQAARVHDADDEDGLRHYRWGDACCVMIGDEERTIVFKHEGRLCVLGADAPCLVVDEDGGRFYIPMRSVK